MGTFIFDELTNTPTLLAPHRAKRPDQTQSVNTIASKGQDKAQIDKTQVFLKGNEAHTPPTVYQDADDWNVRVFQNKFPLVDDHEVIVHSPYPDKDMEDFGCEQNSRIIRAYLNRVSYYGSQDKEVLIFNNRGGKAGASITHPHSQIIALKGIPGIMEKEKSAALKYYNSNNRCYWCDEVKEEMADGSRIVYESPHFVLMVPKACRWSYELILVPKEHKPNFGFINEMEIGDFAKILRAALCGYNELFSRPDRNFWIHTSRYEPFHWHMGFLPHIKTLGGLELGAGIWVSDKASPEKAAEELRPVVSKAYDECTN